MSDRNGRAGAYMPDILHRPRAARAARQVFAPGTHVICPDGSTGVITALDRARGHPDTAHVTPDSGGPYLLLPVTSLAPAAATARHAAAPDGDGRGGRR
jgi:hypothetical protein